MTTRGIFDHLTQAAHISAGMGIPFAEAQEIVSDANDRHMAALREQEYRDAIQATESNVIQFRPRQK
jgi:hypothetical protein